MFQGGMVRSEMRARIDRAHGRASAYVTSDIGAIESGRWHASHLSWKIGATSLVNVGALAGAVCAETKRGVRRSMLLTTHSPTGISRLVIFISFLFNRHLYICVRPATLKAAAAFA